MKSLMLLGLTAMVPAFAASDRQIARQAQENRDWKSLQVQVRKGASSEETIKLLGNFIRSHPSGQNVSAARFAIAETQFQDGKFAQALPHYQLLIDQGDDTYADDSLLRVGEAHYNMKDFVKARKAWEQLSERRFSRSVLIAEAMYGTALISMRDKDYLTAGQILSKLVRKYPSYQDLSKVKEIMGILRFHEKNFTEALEVLEDLDTSPALFYRGLSHFQQKRYLEAAKEFKRLESVSSGAYAELGSYLEAECFRLGKNEAMAAKAYDQFVRHYPDSRLRVYSALHLARALHKLNRLDKALEILTEMRQMKISAELRAYALFLEAETVAATGNTSKAVDLLDASLKLVGADIPDLFASIHVAKGYYLLKEKKHKEAATVIQKLVREFPNHPLGMAAFVVLGNAAYSGKDWLTAISSYEAALLKYPFTSISDVSLGMMLSSYYSAGNYQELVTNGNRVMGVISADYPAQDHSWRAYSHMLLAEAYYKLKLYSQASPYYEKAMKDEALAPHGRMFLAWSLYHEGKNADAIRLAQDIIARPETPAMYKASAYFLLAGSHFNDKDYAAAINDLQTFRRLFPNDPLVPETLLHEGLAQQQGGFHGDAMAAWVKLVRTFPNHPLAQEGQMQIGRLFFQGRKFKQAALAFGRFLDKWPESAGAAEAQWQLAQAHYNGRNDNEAVKAYQEFINRYSGDARVAEAKTQLMQVHYRQAAASKDPDLLAEFVSRYPKTELAADAQYQLSQIRYARKDWRNAIIGFRKLLLDYPGTAQAPLALLAIAHAQEYLKNIEEAVKEYESLLQLFPTSPVALESAMRLGAIHFHREKFKEAAESFRFVIEREAPKDVKMDAHFNMAIALKKGKNYHDAQRAFEDFAENYEETPRAQEALVESAALHSEMLDQPEKAIASYQRLIKMKRIEPALKMEALNEVAKLQLKAGQKKEAMASFTSLLPLSPTNLDARLLGLAQLAAMHEETGAWEKALGVYSAIKTSGGRRDWVKAASKRLKEIRAFLKQQGSKGAGGSGGGE